MTFLVFSITAVRLATHDRVPQTMALQVSGGEIQITFPAEPMKVSRQELVEWVRTAVRAVSHYYGKFPVRRYTLLIEAGNGYEVHGVTYQRKDGGFTRVTIGEEAEVSELKNDWVLTHEMIHLAFPSMAKEHDWIEEGISTYVEPVARAQVGNIPVGEVWREWIRDMPQGLPDAYDQGLDRTRTWGRTYWGGAMFCLVAEVRIRERTHNRKGLRDALRGILNAGGNITEDWSIKKALTAGDKATGTDALMTLHDEMATTPVTVDLDDLWRRLGVRMANGGVAFDNSAKEAAIRDAITGK